MKRMTLTFATAIPFTLAIAALGTPATASNGDRNAKANDTVIAASDAFAELQMSLFNTWSLTDSEREVALVAIKGIGIAEIASFRNTREGTVKAQLNAINRKAGVNGRPQLISLFIEELMSDTLAPAAAA